MNYPFKGIYHGTQGTNVGNLTPEESYDFRNKKHEYTHAEMTYLHAAQTMFDDELERLNRRFISPGRAIDTAGITSAVIIVAGMITMLVFAVLYFIKGNMGAGFGFIGGSLGVVLSSIIIFPVSVMIATFLVPTGDTRAARAYKNKYIKRVHSMQSNIPKTGPMQTTMARAW
ncbi:putative membrane protein [Emiliania huxleyi virus 99B1]|nr:hypothetical protein EhVM1_000024 [Emiliania huxleyi virus M1]CAZ69364.1 putative membrane protein [Emiliania huxleyi virus 99B1]